MLIPKQPLPSTTTEPSAQGRTRAHTMSIKEMRRDMNRARMRGDDMEEDDGEPLDEDRPRTRADCQDMEGPCGYVSCKYNLYLDVNPETGSVRLNFPDREVWELEETCALNVAERGGITLAEVGSLINLTRERVRQMEVHMLGDLRRMVGHEPRVLRLVK